MALDVALIDPGNDLEVGLRLLLNPCLSLQPWHLKPRH